MSIVTKHLQDVQDQDQLLKTVCQPRRIKDAFQKLKLDRLDNTLLFSKMETHASPLHPMEPFAMLVEPKALIFVQRHLQDVQVLKTVCQWLPIKDAFQKLKLDGMDETLLFSKMETHVGTINPLEPIALLLSHHTKNGLNVQ